MLSIKPIGSSATELNYYSALGSAENLDYYSNDGARPGIWWGIGAEKLGLVGDVAPEEFKNVLEGWASDRSKRLVQFRQRGSITQRRSGWDLTFSLPKDFSLAMSVADLFDRKLLDQVAKTALQKTLAQLQRLCGKTRRGKNTLQVEDAGLAAAVFWHDTARGVPGEIPDPAVHAHVVLVNVSTRSDGSTGTVDSRFLFKPNMKLALGALFRTELSKQLEALGLKTERVQDSRTGKMKSWFAMPCVPESLVRQMSKRRLEIEKWLRKRGLRGAKAAERAALATRHAKTKFLESELRVAWRKSAAEHGFTSDVLSNELYSTARSFDIEMEKQRSVSKAVESIVSSKARFTEIELIQHVATEAQCRGLGIEDVTKAIDELLDKSTEIVRLQDQKGVKTFTTKEMLEIEKRMLGSAVALSERNDHSVPIGDVDCVLARFPTISPDQARIVRDIATGSDISCIQGIAGSGKTFALRVCREVFESQGYEVIGTALASRTANELQEASGIKSTHTHQLIHRLERGATRLGPDSIVVCDEAGMLGTRQKEKLVSLVEESGGKLILIGDWTQLQPIDAGAAFRGISDQVSYSKLDKIIRQNAGWARQSVSDFRVGEAYRALLRYQERGLLFIGEDRDEAMQRLVEDWQETAIEDGESRSTIVLASTHLEVRELNQQLQTSAYNAGLLTGKPIELDGFEIYEGDRVMATKNSPKHCLRNGTIADVVKISGKVLSLRLSNGITVNIDTGEYSDLTLGRAMTVHKFQGGTCEFAFVLTGNSMTDREICYVQSSRAREMTRIYSDKITGGEYIGELAQKMSRSRQKELAHEYLISGG